jgi:ABC-type proline/glycine betaine transport system substrate-binding protein
MFRYIRTLWLSGTLIAAAALSSASAQTPLPILVAYAGQNETVGPMWVGIENGTFK